MVINYPGIFNFGIIITIPYENYLHLHPSFLFHTII